MSGKSGMARWARTLIALACILGLAVMAGCGSDDDDDSDAGSSGPTKLSIVLSNHPVATVSVPYLVAMENGAFADEGIQIEDISGSAGGGDTVRNVLSGRLPFGDVSTTAAAQAYMAGQPVVIIGGGTQTTAELKYVAKSGSDLESIEDLPGQTASFTSPGSVTEAVLKLSLEEAGIGADAVESRATGGVGEGLTALQGGGVDIAPIVEPILSSDPDPYKVIWNATEYVPHFQESVVITSRDYLDDNPELARRFLAARAQGVEAAIADPALAAEVWGKPLKLDPKVVEPVIEDLNEAGTFGVGLSLEAMQTLDESMHVLGQVEDGEEVPWSEIIDQDYLPEGAPRIDPEEISMN